VIVARSIILLNILCGLEMTEVSGFVRMISAKMFKTVFAISFLVRQRLKTGKRLV